VGKFHFFPKNNPAEQLRTGLPVKLTLGHFWYLFPNRAKYKPAALNDHPCFGLADILLPPGQGATSTLLLPTVP
jgi:hypothetical protein